MTKALLIPARQIEALCKGAAKAGYAPIVQIGEVFVRLVPERNVFPIRDGQAVDDGEDFRL